jgi:hypothetical protein
MTETQHIAPPGCSRCSHRQGWLPYVSAEVNGYACASRCTCARGAWLAERDRARAQQRGEHVVRSIPQQRVLAQHDVKMAAAGDRG